jgi:hypothetical protein
MGFVVLSDYINKTNLCETFSEKNKCSEQLAVLQYIEKGGYPTEESLSLEKTKLLALYKDIKKPSADEWKLLLSRLFEKYLSSLQ